MKKGIFAAALVTALAFGFSGEEAQADTPFFISVGGPRGGISFGSGYRGFGGLGYGGGGYGYGGSGFYQRRVAAYPYGITTRNFSRNYYRPRGHYHYHAPVIRSYRSGYGCY